MVNLPPFDPGPIVGVRLYRRDVVVVRRGRMHPNRTNIPPQRGEIVYLSRKSRKRLAFIANNTHVRFQTMVTLTYPKEYSNDGKSVKKDLHAFLVWVRRRFARPAYLWFLEFQKRGAPHIHLLLDYPLPVGKAARALLYGEVSQQWYTTVGSEDPFHLAAGTRCERIRKPDGAARYCLKYAYKTKQKCVPAPYRNVGRFWGCSRDVTPTETRVIPMDEATVRAIIADWEYAPAENTLMYQTIFGCADRFRQYSGIRVWADLTNIRISAMLAPSASIQQHARNEKKEQYRWAPNCT